MSLFWEDRYNREKMIWGKKPSTTVELADKFFEAYEVRRILVPGSGYDRNAKYFAEEGYDVTGVELSRTAVDMAEKYSPKVKHIVGSFLEIDLPKNHFDGIYCFNVLHLFLSSDRQSFVAKCSEALKPSGFAFFTVFSEKEADYGKGGRIEENTFETRPGRPAHYFTERDLLEHFSKFTCIQTGLAQDPENHGKEGAHVHTLRYILVQKPNRSSL
jgi:SAM-dependent methyltransferase